MMLQEDRNLEEVIEISCGGLEIRDALEICFDFQH